MCICVDKVISTTTQTTQRMPLSLALVQDVISKYEDKIKQKSKADMDKLFATMDISILELASYQTDKSRALMAGIIDLDLAQYLYAKLCDWPNTSLAERVTLTQVFMRIKIDLVKQA